MPFNLNIYKLDIPSSLFICMFTIRFSKSMLEYMLVLLVYIELGCLLVSRIRTKISNSHNLCTRASEMYITWNWNANSIQNALCLPEAKMAAINSPFAG